MDQDSKPSRPLLSAIGLVLSLGVIGLIFVTWAAGTLGAADGQGLAGGAIVLGYGIIGGLIAMGLGVVLCILLPAHIIKPLGRGLFVLTILTLIVLIILAYMRQQASAIPDEAYEGIPAFRAGLRQIVVTDPNLRVFIGVDGPARAWQQTGPAPENMHCTGTIAPDTLRRVSNALAELDTLAPDTLAACQAANDTAERDLTWTFKIPRSLRLTPTCLQIKEVRAAIAQMERASLSGRDVSCD